MQFLATDQSDYRIRLFSDSINNRNELIDESIWRFPNWKREDRIRPTDAKRVDIGDCISVIVATHGLVAEVAYNFQEPLVIAQTHNSCHSVEKLPDGNLLSVCSKDNCISVHYNKQSKEDYYILASRNDFPLQFGHGVVFDAKRNCVWGLGTSLKQFRYEGGDFPELILEKTFETPDISGHDLFPSSPDKLLLTVGKGVYEFDILTEKFHLVKEIKKVKSAVRSMISGEVYITVPMRRLTFSRWQTHTIRNLNTEKDYKRPRGKFYKVRLWEKNKFSYDDHLRSDQV